MSIFTTLGRKFFMAESTILIAWIFLFIGKLDQGGFVTIVIGVAGLYLGANVVQKNKKEVEG